MHDACYYFIYTCFGRVHVKLNSTHAYYVTLPYDFNMMLNNILIDFSCVRTVLYIIYIYSTITLY